MTEGRWVDRGSADGKKVSFVVEALSIAAAMVGYEPEMLVAGVASFFGPMWSAATDADFESDMSLLVNAVRLMRAKAQARGMVKS